MNEPFLRRGDRFPHVEITTRDGARVPYVDLWQSKNLLLIVLAPDDPGSRTYLAEIDARMSDLTINDTACVVSFDAIRHVGRPSVVIADRWGEVQFAIHEAAARDLPAVDEIIDWLRYVQHQCPECQGEAR
jgi:hypothetical protein